VDKFIQKFLLIILLTGSSVANAGERMISPVSVEETLTYMECPVYNTSLKPEENLYREAHLVYRDESVKEAIGDESSKNGLLVDLVITPGTQRYVAEIQIIRAFRVGFYVGQSASFGSDPHSIIEGNIIRNDNGTVEFEGLGTGVPSVYSSPYSDYPALDVTLTNSTLLADKGKKASSTSRTSLWGSTYGIRYGTTEYRHPCDQR